ncbi:MAG: phosphatidylserine decarboxylase [Nitrospirae bacterium]|nr:phosphatidylserine decarboxylase [Nitrospirota bacterium]
MEHRPPIALLVLRLLPLRIISRLVGWLADRRLPSSVLQPAIRWYVGHYGVNMDEADVPPGGYLTLGEFFVRPLKEGARPVDPSPDGVISPVDGRLVTAGTIEDGRLIQTKGLDYSAADLLGSPQAASPFQGGTFATIYLSPRDYHRIHAPLAARVTAVCHRRGRLLPVNDLSVPWVKDLFSTNERIVVTMETDAGPVAVVMVGALNVGRIRLAFEVPPAPRRADWDRTPDREIRLMKGDELGRFELGSTVILLFGKERIIADPLPIGTEVRIGSRLAKVVPR